MNLELLPDPLMYGVAVLLFGGWIGLFWVVRMLFTGKLCTGRELEDKNKTIGTLELANKELNSQNAAILNEWIPSANAVLTALRKAAEEARS